MEPFTTAAIAIGSVVATKALEKTGEKIGETLWQQTGNFLNSLRKELPDTVTAIEKAPEQPLDYGKAVLETEAAAKANPELAQRMQELVAMVETEPLLKDLVNSIKSQTQQTTVINSQKLAEQIKNVLQGNTFNGPVTF
jgi:primosomal protein N''